MFDELKNSWKDQSSNDLPSVDSLLDLVKKEGSKMATNLLVGAFGVGIGICAMVLIWYFIPFKYDMTRYSLLMMGMFMIGAIVNMLNMHNKMPKAEDATIKTEDYVNLWMNYREQLSKASKSFMKIYFIAITLGMCIYLFEITEGDTIFMIVAYGSVLGWMALSWFVLKPKWEKSTLIRVQEIIDNYKTISDQLK